MPHLIKRMRRLLEDKTSLQLGNSDIIFTIRSQQNKGNIGTLKLRNI